MFQTLGPSSNAFHHRRQITTLSTSHHSFAIRESRMYNSGMALKPQDIVVVLKLCGYGSNRPPFAQIAADLAMSPSEVHGAVKRAQAAHLLHGPELLDRPNVSAIEEFLIHGLKYAF